MSNYGAHAKHHRHCPGWRWSTQQTLALEEEKKSRHDMRGFPRSTIFTKRLEKTRQTKRAFNVLRLHAKKTKPGGGECFNIQRFTFVLDLEHNPQCVQNKSQLQIIPEWLRCEMAYKTRKQMKGGKKILPFLLTTIPAKEAVDTQRAATKQTTKKNWQWAIMERTPNTTDTAQAGADQPSKHLRWKKKKKADMPIWGAFLARPFLPNAWGEKTR